MFQFMLQLDLQFDFTLLIDPTCMRNVGASEYFVFSTERLQQQICICSWVQISGGLLGLSG